MAVALKGMQTVVTFVLTYMAYSLFQNQLVKQSKSLDTPIFPDLSGQILLEPPNRTLLNIVDFEYTQVPHKDLCKDKELLFFTIVHSKPSHFKQRQAIRSTWGKLRKIKDKHKTWDVELVFLLGQSNDEIIEKITTESQSYGDIVQGSFIDSYHNLTYKHLMGYKWTSSYCQNAQFILKADDDAYIDISGLYLYLSRALGNFEENYSRKFLAGNVFPSGTSPKREGKWAVSWSDYPWDNYPSYLGGLAYLVTPDLASDIYKAAHDPQVNYLWVDDVFVTGVLMNSLNVRPFFMNMRYAYDQSEVFEWLRRSKLSFPFTFIHIDVGQKDWLTLFNQLYSRTKTIYNISNGIFKVSETIA